MFERAPLAPASSGGGDGLSGVPRGGQPLGAGGVRGRARESPPPAGWPSPAENYVETDLDLHKLAVRNPPATFFMRVIGDSMLGCGIHNGDLLVVDRSRTPSSGKVVVASVDGELTIKRLVKRKEKTYLCPENPAYPEIDVTDREETSIWGVATYVLHQL